MKITITDIVEHVIDNSMMDGDASHEGRWAVSHLYADEYERKVDGNEWDGLPFSCDADSVEDAIDKYNDAFCEYDYIKAADVDYHTED